MRHFRRGGAGRSGGWCQTRQCLGSGRHSWEEAGRADADLIPGGRRVAASAPVTTACVPVSGRKPARWQVASAAWALRRALPRVFRRPGAQASVSGRALGPAAPVRRAWPRRCFGWLRPAPAGGPAQPPVCAGASSGPEWGDLWQFAGDSPISLFYLVLDWAVCTL